MGGEEEILSSQSDSSTVTMTFLSYNMTGADFIKCQWLNELCLEYGVNFTSIQEHFKTTKTTDQWFKDQFKDWFSYVIPAYRLPGTESGRGRGGLVQLTNKITKLSRQRVISSSKRIVAQRLVFDSINILWINSYMPCDPQSASCDNTELIQTLAEIENLISRNPDCEILWSGDMNWDMRRKSEFSVLFHEFVNKTGLKSVFDLFPADFTHTHTDGVSTSVIDHFILSPNLLNLVEDCYVIHRGDNLSRHCPIILKVKVAEKQSNFQTNDPPPPRCLPSWSLATESEIISYNSSLQAKLNDLYCPVSVGCCQDPQCSDISHHTECDSLMLDIIFSIIECSFLMIPLGGKPRKPLRKGKTKCKIIPGWKTNIEPFRKHSLACYH